MTTIPVEAPGVPGLPFGATTGSVRALVLDTAAEGIRVGQLAQRVSDDTLAGWIGQAAAIVSAATWQLSRLPLGPLDAGLDQARATLTCKHLVELYAASLLQDVTHPERGTDDRPGKPLLDRFQWLLEQLVGQIDAALSGGDGGDALPGTDDDPGLAAAWLPAFPLVHRLQGF